MKPGLWPSGLDIAGFLMKTRRICQSEIRIITVECDVRSDFGPF
jgi:hypothetical protein